MGLDASVMCNCFRDGRTTPPPFPREWLEIDGEGYLNLTDEHDSAENCLTLHEWGLSCCQHEAMDFASEHISNWTGYRLFQSALAEIGWQYFPVLKEELPNLNGGTTQRSSSAKALQELDFFASRGVIGKKTVLVDSASGEDLYERVAAYEGVFIRSGSRGINVGLSEFELFAVDSETGVDLFRATKIKQFRKDGATVTGDGDGIVWEDLDEGTVYESGIAIRGRQIPWDDGSWQKPDGTCRFEYPTVFHVEERQRTAEDFSYIVRALKTVFTASVETGNPVRWC